MKFFIESVTTYTTSGKTRKGATLQRAAQRFEHQILGDEYALEALVGHLRVLVDTVNSSFKGQPLKLVHNADSCWISVMPENPQNDNVVFSIQYARVGLTLWPSDVRHEISDSLSDQGLTQLQSDFWKGGRYV